MSVALMTHIVYVGPEGDRKPQHVRRQPVSIDDGLEELLAAAAALRGGGVSPGVIYMSFHPTQMAFAVLTICFGKVQGLDQSVDVEFPFFRVPDMMAKLLASGRGEASGMVTLWQHRGSGGGRKKRPTPVSAEAPAAVGLQL